MPYYAHTNAHKYCGDNMQTLYDHDAPKKPTNLSLNSDLLKKTKALNINLSATLEQALREKLAEREAAKWTKKNKRAIQAYNNFVEENGCFADEYRQF
jgi:antitoxin CcdA